MIYIEKYNRYIYEAKKKIGELHLKAAANAISGFDSQNEIALSSELQDSLDFIVDEYNNASNSVILNIIDHYVAKAKLVIFGVIV